MWPISSAKQNNIKTLFEENVIVKYHISNDKSTIWQKEN